MDNLPREFAENATLLAQQTIDFLKPHLLAAAGTLTDQALAKAGQGASRLYGWLKSKFTLPIDKTVLEETIKSPTDDRNWRSLQHQLVELLQTDVTLQKELAALLPAPPRTSQSINSSGNNNVNIQTTGKNNATNVSR